MEILPESSDPFCDFCRESVSYTPTHHDYNLHWLLSHNGSHNLQQLSKWVVNCSCSFMASSSFCSRQSTIMCTPLQILDVCPISVLLRGLRKGIDFVWPVCLMRKVKVLVAQCLTLCNPMDYSPSGSFVHGILQARILEWIAISFSRRSSQGLNEVTHIAGTFFTIWATREAHLIRKGLATSKFFNMSMLNIYFLD